MPLARPRRPRDIPAMKSLPACVFCTLFILGVAPGLGAPLQDPGVSLFIRGSSAYGTPAPASPRTALLAVTPRWDGLAGQTRACQKIAVGEVAVVISSREIDCESVFRMAPTAPDSAFHVVAGRILAFPESGDWTSTTVGKALSNTEPATGVSVEAFSIDVYAATKKVVSKEKVSGPVGLLRLTRESGQWMADLAFKDSKASLQGKVPLVACPVTDRKTAVLMAKKEDRAKAPDSPLLGLGRVLDAAFNYGER